MKIAVISDIHDNVWRLEKALRRHCTGGSRDVLLCCGDLCAPFTLKQIAESFDGPVHLVFGNNDGDKWLLTTIATKRGECDIARHVLRVRDRWAEAGDGALSLRWDAHWLNRMKYDAVFYGHNHTQATERHRQDLARQPR